MQLENQIALVTGGQRGIGEAIVRAFTAAGARVIFTSEKDDPLGHQLEEELQAAGMAADYRVCDLTKLPEIARFGSELIDQYGRLDILVNNAGVGLAKTIEDITLQDWDKIMNVNLRGALFMTQAIVTHMKKQNSGKILFTASLGAHLSCFPGDILYCSSKAALRMAARCLAKELAPHGIRVATVSPGCVQTPMNQEAQNDPAQREAQASRTPTGRAFIQPEEIAKAFVFLASDDASALVGSELIADDGWSIC